MPLRHSPLNAPKLRLLLAPPPTQRPARDCALGRLPWVESLPDACARSAIAAARMHSYAAGTVVTHVGDPAGLVAILEGSVLIEMGCSPDDVGPSDWLAGPASFLTGVSLLPGRSVLSLTANSDVVVARWPKGFTFPHGDGDPYLPRALAEILATMARRAMATVADMQLPTAARRIAAVVLRLSSTADELTITQETLGRLANVCRSITGRILLAMAREAIVEINYGKIVVRDRQAVALIRNGSGMLTLSALRLEDA